MQVKLIYNHLQFNLTVLLYIVTLWCKKTELLNVTQGSYKLQVRSPAGSHLSKLVATPAPQALSVGVDSDSCYVNSIRFNMNLRTAF